MTIDRGRTPKKMKLRARKKENTRQAILAAAEKFFSEKPFDEVILEDIAEAAFVSRTTLYNYFKNKDAIFEKYSDKMSGINQILQLCEISFTSALENPPTHIVIREFYKRLQHDKISLKELDTKITQLQSKGYRMRTPGYETLLKSFGESYLIEFYISLQRNTTLWTNAVKKGKSDGTISNDLNEDQIVEFLYMLLMGMEEEMRLREPALARAGLDITTIKENVLNLIASFLKK